MDTTVDQVKLPCIVEIRKHPQDGMGCVISIPDLCIDVKGSNFVEAMARAVEITTGLYYYYEEHNVKFPQKATWEEVDKHCRAIDAFPTYVVVQ